MNADGGRREGGNEVYLFLGVYPEPLPFLDKSNGVTSDVSYYSKSSDFNISELKGVGTPTLVLIAVTENLNMHIGTTADMSYFPICRSKPFYFNLLP